jgi:hypothetical protein
MADANVLRLGTQKQKQLESIVYEPFEHKVNLELSYEEKLRKSVSNTLYAVERERPNENQMSGQKYNLSIKKKNNCQII